MTDQKKKVSIIFVTYNTIQDYDTCFSSLEKQTYKNFEVIISDCNSSDGTQDYFKKNYPHYNLIENENLGYGGGNNVGFRHGTGDYFLVLNNDIELEPNFLEKLIEGLESDPKAKMATGKLLLFHERKKVNCVGNRVHFTGMTFCNGIYEPSENYTTNLYPNNITGACFLLTREWLEKLGGGYDTDYAYAFSKQVLASLEDVDLSFRTQMMGYKVLCVTSAIMYHKYNVKLSTKKLFFLECGRYILVSKYYPLQMIIAFLPGFILMEFVVLGYSLIRGGSYLKAKLKTYWWLIKNFNRLAEKRRKNKDFLKNGDMEIFKTLSYKISIAELVEKNHFMNILESSVNRLFKFLFDFGCLFIPDH